MPHHFTNGELRQDASRLISTKCENWQYSAVARRRTSTGGPPPNAEVGARLAWLRETIYPEYTQGRFAEFIGVGGTRYNQWETGKKLIPVEQALRLRETHDWTLDFIYGGYTSGLPHKIAVAYLARNKTR
jgi:hypothetical protein